MEHTDELNVLKCIFVREKSMQGVVWWLEKTGICCADDQSCHQHQACHGLTHCVYGSCWADRSRTAQSNVSLDQGLAPINHHGRRRGVTHHRQAGEGRWQRRGVCVCVSQNMWCRSRVGDGGRGRRWLPVLLMRFGSQVHKKQLFTAHMFSCTHAVV